MYDVSAQYHKDELAKKQLLEEVISTITTTSSSITAILNNIYIDTQQANAYLSSINVYAANSTAELQTIHNRQTNGTQKTQIIPTVSPATLTVTESAVTSSGSTAADNLYMTFVTSEDFAGSINGITIPKLSVKEYPYLPGHKYPSISYTRTAGTLYIIEAK
jgi:hypothetical protein